jgi:predicted DNA-binding protein
MTDVNIRFWSKVNVLSDDDCWEWSGGKYPSGYGTFSFMGKSMQAHRVSYILTTGEIPPRMCICHKCDNPPCVNPRHLFLGTYQDNTNDMIKKGRWKKGEMSMNSTKRAFNLYLSEEVIEKLEKMANYDGKSKSQYVSDWIEADWDMQLTDRDFNNAVTTNDKEKK